MIVIFMAEDPEQGFIFDDEATLCYSPFLTHCVQCEEPIPATRLLPCGNTHGLYPFLFLLVKGEIFCTISCHDDRAASAEEENY